MVGFVRRLCCYVLFHLREHLTSLPLRLRGSLFYLLENRGLTARLQLLTIVLRLTPNEHCNSIALGSRLLR